ncbi:MAG: prepilin-type N-terminal cleavage/methylation domain-containing protein [Deltaproteobacteria bacterium]|nr:prepilin-type N-terminal cleavage/methylation domain-containing protein [Deltaproteobacteria bacterium]
MRRNREQGGFTLIEVLVSLVLAAIAMIGVIALYRTQTSASSFSRRMTEATMMAEDQLERIRTQVATGSGSTSSLDETGKVVTGGIFTRSFDVQSGGLNYDEIKVVVSWIEDGGSKAVTLFGRRNK